MRRTNRSSNFSLRVDHNDAISDESIRGELPWLRLPLSGAPPYHSDDLTAAQRSDLERHKEECLRTSRQLSVAACRVDLPREDVDLAAVRLGWKRFFLSHFAFFYNFALIGYCYRTICETLHNSDPQGLATWLDRTCVLWRSAGAFMLYGIDFSPTEKIYKIHIRSSMPEGLSGTWMREYEYLNQQKRLLRGIFMDEKGGHCSLPTDANLMLRQAEKVYHLQHSKVMQACVPEMVSLLQDYELAHGSLATAEDQYRIYDDWFHVSRSPGIDRFQYLQKAYALFSEVSTDILTSTSLQQETLSFLEQGIGVMVEIMDEQTLRNA
ncbi:MAG TPA: hypothetical protein VF179_20010 [Thermoanaerobaculia bacterium]|nr:hypothetical protein [Thermoanaerobaculia bacterium]